MTLPSGWTAPHQRLLQINRRRPAAPRPAVGGIPLGGHNDIVVAAKPHTNLGPLVKVLLGRDGAADALLLAHRPVLLEGAGALDGRLVDARAGEDLVVALLVAEGALGRPRLVRRQVCVRLDDVVLDQRVARPAVDGEVARARGVVGAGVLDGAA